MHDGAPVGILYGVAGVFDRIAVAVDGSPESLDAAHEVGLLAPESASITVVEVTQPLGHVPPGFGVVTAPVLQARHEAEDALKRAAARVGAERSVQTALLEGAPIPTLLGMLAEHRATLVAVGIHRHSRAVGVALGSVATAMLHDAPCSVFVGRSTVPENRRPATIAVGVDGSPGAALALAAARELGQRLGAEVRAVVACDTDADVERLEAELEAETGVVLVETTGSAVDALEDTAADLLVVGSRGLHGLRSLGSVSERLAHRAPCSVLVVRATG